MYIFYKKHDFQVEPRVTIEIFKMILNVAYFFLK